MALFASGREFLRSHSFFLEGITKDCEKVTGHWWSNLSLFLSFLTLGCFFMSMGGC